MLSRSRFTLEAFSPSLQESLKGTEYNEDAHHESTDTRQAGKSSDMAAEARPDALRGNDILHPAPIVALSARTEYMSSPQCPPSPRQTTSSQLLPPRQMSYTPRISSPLNPSSPTTSLKSSESHSGSNEEKQNSGSDAPHLVRSQSGTNIQDLIQPLHPKKPRSMGRKMSSELGLLRKQRSTPAIRSETPMSLSDLGKDYSRYPSDTPNLSQRNSSTASLSLPQEFRRVRNDSAQSSELTTFSDLPNFVTDPARNTPRDAGPNLPYSMFLDDRLGGPTTADCGYGFPMYIDEKESDDELHTPHPDDDVRLKVKFREHFHRNQLCTLIGMVMMIVGLIIVFVVVPILSFSGAINWTRFNETPLDQMPGEQSYVVNPSEWDYVNSKKYPHFENMRLGLIDPTTPSSAMTKTGLHGDNLQLVFSDEFNTQNRSFYPGDDPFWTAQDLWYGATQDLDWYDADAPTTYNGALVLRLDQFQEHGMDYRSGMINSWNQICFKGGLLEVSISLPGPAGVPGFWPGAWTMGNLGRPGYKATTEGLWPYTYNSCDSGITPNQSMTDGTSLLPGQKLPSCTCPDEDHPTPGTGRGAPEIDVIEASAFSGMPVVTQSYQVAPFDIWYQPNYDHLAIHSYNVTQMNTYCGGPFQQAISGTTSVNKSWYDNQKYQKYGFEYTPGTGGSSSISWFVGNDMSYMMTGDAIGPNGNIQHRIISEEPMAVVLNMGFSTAWVNIEYGNLKFPTTMYVDYVRWYQRPDSVSVTCDPPGYETTAYIKEHADAYSNPNWTSWDDTGYGWPKHKMNTDC
ncbi:hypothetical protein MMC09_006049 [Bachmanniomyces sp. S44760]|nr:hypothetical protein [Bachmanniomyces sp. S44760]